jgi:flagellar basal-body rod protein FlgC
MSTHSISASGLSAASLRLQVSARNVANIADTGPLPNANASSTAASASAYAPLRVDQVAVAGGGTAATVTAALPSYVTRYDSGAPSADKNGQVAAPNVDLANEIAQQITAASAFAANAKAIQAGSSAIRTLFDIKV